MTDQAKQIRDVLREHWITGMICNHEAMTDRATCSCSRWRCEEMPSIGAAVDAWISHVIENIEGGA